jgi:hypothetical protein
MTLSGPGGEHAVVHGAVPRSRPAHHEWVGSAHLLASILLDHGYGIHEVAERLGHDPGTLTHYYSRLNADRRRQATGHIAKLINTA